MDTDSVNNAGRLMGLWFNLASNLTQAMLSGMNQPTPPEAFRQVRSAQLNAWGEYYQELMRTPEFLGMMKQWTSNTVQFRKQWTDFLGQLQHELQGASRQDIDQLMLSVRHLERRLVDGVEEICSQLEDLEARLEAMEGRRERNSHSRSDDPERRRRRRRRRQPPGSSEAAE